KAWQLSEEAHDQRRAVRALVLVGSADYYQGRLSEALDDLKRAERDAADLHYVASEKQAKRLMGNTLRQLGRYDEALHKFQDWFGLNQRSRPPDPEGPMVLTVTILYREMGDLDRAERTCREALRLARASGDHRFEAATMLSLGALMKDRKRYQDAIPLH